MESFLALMLCVKSESLYEEELMNSLSSTGGWGKVTEKSEMANGGLC